ncbi:hypothetical protein [Thiomonas sp.]|jgi:hypothetical protein|uniref:hypothetical protein n=1 Tax=Thiomonas sp. TaxID=2047785 RepID=UPI002601D3B1|nr:hypothetical protein [Thiomonas sp.]
MKRNFLIPAAAALALGSFAAAPARADGPPVSFSITVGNPPPVYAPAPVYAPPPVTVAPQAMVWLPEIGAYVALGLQQPIFYVGGVYYYRYRDAWYTGPGYGGPWRRGAPPGALRRFRDPDWGRYQRMAHDYHDRRDWREFHPGPPRGPERGPARGPERGPGSDHGRGPDRGDHGRGHGPDRGDDQGPGRGH